MGLACPFLVMDGEDDELYKYLIFIKYLKEQLKQESSCLTV